MTPEFEKPSILKDVNVSYSASSIPSTFDTEVEVNLANVLGYGQCHVVIAGHHQAHVAAMKAQFFEESLMAECMRQFRADMIAVGVVSEACPPMMMTEGVGSYIAGLQAEVERQKGRAETNAWNHRHAKQDLQTMTNKRDAVQSELTNSKNLTIEAQDYAVSLQSDLTKARELLVRAKRWCPHGESVWSDVGEYLARQSAPAAKGEADV